MLLRVFKQNRGRWCVATLMTLLCGCAHDPAPKARCHGPWTWVNAPAQALTGGVSRSHSPSGNVPAQPGPADSSVEKHDTPSKDARGGNGLVKLPLEIPPTGGHP